MKIAMIAALSLVLSACLGPVSEPSSGHGSRCKCGPCRAVRLPFGVQR